MPLKTTVIGSYPKPSYLPTPDWFRNPDMTQNMNNFNRMTESCQNLEKLYEQALKDVIKEQTDLGIDVITDGELRRECYYLHFCRKTKGIDFHNFKNVAMRNAACVVAAPVIVDKLERGETFAWKEWRTAQDQSSTPVKYTLPGPMTILNSIADDFYQNRREASEDLVKILNSEILDLAAHGCRFIQLDEPVLVRDPATALEYAIDHAEACFRGVGNRATKIVHVCCGYPSYLDEDGYDKAEPECYQAIAARLDKSIFDCVSLEDAHRRNDLSLFQKFHNMTLIVGVVEVARSEIEEFENIRNRVEEILKIIPKERLILAPDCGLGYLKDDKTRIEKLRVMVKVAQAF